MKYPIDKELKSLSIYSGSVVGWMYPMINIGYRLRKCRSDKCISVRKVAPLGDPVEITVRGYELSLRKDDADILEME